MRSNRRKLAAIMFTDIVGYTSMMGTEERKAFDILKRSRRIHSRLIRKYKGRLLKEMGDGILASFESAIDAVICALSLQKATIELQVPLRIGIHMGDVIFERKDVLGDGVNIASRIQGLTKTNGIVISETIYNNIRNKEHLVFNFLGKQALKGVQSEIDLYEVSCQDYASVNVTIDTGELVKPLGFNRSTVFLIAFLFIATMGASYFLAPRWSGKVEFGKSILVLPFDNFTGSDSLDYVIAGMHSSLIGELGRISGLRVISPHTSNTFKDSEKSLSEIAKELNVNAIVDAAVVCFGDSICFQPNLINIDEREHQIWAGNFTKAKSQVFNLYSQLTKSITEEIHLALTPEEAIMLNEDKTVDPDAIELYLKGNFHLFQFTPDDILLASNYYTQALEIEREFALAYAGLSDVGAYMLVLGMLVPEEAGRMMRENALKCLAIDSLVPDGHYALAQTSYAIDWNWNEGIKGFQRAIALNPNNAKFHIFYSHLLTSLKRFDEAIEHAETAVQLDPYNAFFHGLYGAVLSWAGQYEKALDRNRIGMDLDPLNPFPIVVSAAILHEIGRKEEALDYLKKGYDLIGDKMTIKAMEDGYQHGGVEGAYFNVARQDESFWRNNYVKPHKIASFYSMAGETTKVLEWLDSCYIYRDHDMVYAAVNRYNPAVKKHPRYIALLKKLNLPID